MKKILLALSLGFTSFAALSNPALAQRYNDPVAFNDTKAFKSSVRYIAALENPAYLGELAADAKTVNNKALKDFGNRFNNPANAKWFSDNNGFVSYFMKDGYGNRAYYDKKGHWKYSLLFYSEDKLPRDIRNIVRSQYFDMQISLVEEVQTTEGMGYIIHVEDHQLIRILKVSKDGEVQIMQELTKQ